MTQTESRPDIAYRPPDDEISLVELWQIVARRKRLVFAVFLVCVVAGAAYAFLKSPVYEAQVKLRIGQTNGVLLEVSEDLSAQLMSTYGERVAEGVTRERPFLKSAAPQKNAPTSIDLLAEGDSPTQVVELLTRIVAQTRKQHDAVFDQNVTLIADRVAALKQQAATLKDQFDEATALLRKLERTDPVQASLLMIERGQLSSALRSVDQETFAIEKQLVPPQTQHTVLLGDISAPESPSAPKIGLAFLVSAMLGLMGGVVSAFILEFVTRARSDN